MGLGNAHKNRNKVGVHVQSQVKKLADATKNVAEKIHYLHQNRVDGLNDGVTQSIYENTDLIKQKAEGLDKKIDGAIASNEKRDADLQNLVKDNKIEIDQAISRNNARAHALARDIVERHGARHFRKNTVGTKFYKQAQTEQDDQYQTEQDETLKAYAERLFADS